MGGVSMMNSRMILLVFGLPAALMALMGLAFAIEDGDARIFVFMTTVGLVSVALVFVLAMILTRRMLRRHRRGLEQLARERGGVVVESLLGECQLQLPTPQGQLQIDFRSINPRATFAAGGGGPYTRFGLVPMGRPLPQEEHHVEVGADEPFPEGRFPHEIASAALGLTGVAQGRWRLVLLGKGSPPSVDFWLPGWLSDPERIGRIADEALPWLVKISHTTRWNPPPQRSP